VHGQSAKKKAQQLREVIHFFALGLGDQVPLAEGTMSERDLFIAALQITDPAERAAWLDRRCASDATLRQRLEILLQALDQAGSLLDNPVVASPATTGCEGQPVPAPDAGEEPFLEGPGTVIGPYKLLEQIGEGGFGVVFLAEQIQPVRRKVAFTGSITGTGCSS
jgi:eukaryotic-like serine/threonine-protein kinase